MSFVISKEQASEIMKAFGRGAPCPHFTREPVGFGHYHHCHDCGRDVPSEMLKRAEEASEKHDKIAVILAACLRECIEEK